MTSRFSLWATVAAAVGCFVATLQAAPKPLSSRVVQALNRDVLPAYRAGNSLAILQSLSKIAGRMPGSQLEQLDEWLTSRKMPAAKSMLTSARMKLVFQNGGRGLPKPTGQELLLILTELREQILDIYKQKATHPAFSKSEPPSNLKDFEKLLWDVHVFDNRLSSSLQMAAYAAQLSKSTRQFNRKNLTAEQIAVLDTDFSKAVESVTALRRDLEQREAELRLQRIQFAEGVLVGGTKPYINRLQATFALHVDGSLLTNFLKQKPVLTSPALNDPNLAEDLKARVQQALKAGGDLGEKSQLLFAGLHWWFRGRYGAGPDGGGLLKSALAMQSEQAQFALFMPAQTPKPTNPLQKTTPTPRVDRRHHYIWAFEDRTISSRQTISDAGSSFQADITTQGFH